MHLNREDGQLPDNPAVGEPATPLNPLILQLSDAQQIELAAIIREDFKNSEDARNVTSWGVSKDGAPQTFDDKYASLVALYEGNDEIRPEKWMCGRSVKIAQAVVELLVARLIQMCWDSASLNWKPVERSDKKLVRQISDMMKWVVRVWMKFDENVEPIVRACTMMGSGFVSPYWSSEKKDLGQVAKVPVINESGEPLVGDDGQPLTLEERMLYIDEKPAVKIIPITHVYLQPGCTDVQKEPVIILEEFYYDELEQAQREGLAFNVSDKIKDATSKKLGSRFGEELDKAENVATVNAARRSMPIEVLAWYGRYDADSDGFAEDVCVKMTNTDDVVFQAYKLGKVSRKAKRPLIHFPFIRRLHKLLSIGVLEQIRPLAEEVDACFRQMQDANTLSIMRWGFYDPNSDYDPSTHVAKPRAMYPVSNPTQNVYFPDMQIPTERIINAIKMILEFIERLTAASSYAMGKESNIVGGSGTATRVATIQQNANVRFNMPMLNLRRAFAELMTDIFDLCVLNAPRGLEKRVLGEDAEPIFESSEEIEAALSLKLDAYLDFNPTFGDVDTERELAVSLYDKFVMGGNPFVVQNPVNLWKVSANVVRAFGEDPVNILGPSMEPKDTNDPIEEHTLLRSGRMIYVEPSENHLEHIVVHQRVFSDPEVLLWPPETLEFLRQHIAEHTRVMGAMISFGDGQKKGDGVVAQNQTRANGGNGASAKGAPGESGVPSSAGPVNTAAANQAQGTTLGSPVVQ